MIKNYTSGSQDLSVDSGGFLKQRLGCGHFLSVRVDVKYTVGKKHETEKGGSGISLEALDALCKASWDENFTNARTTGQRD